MKKYSKPYVLDLVADTLKQINAAKRHVEARQLVQEARVIQVKLDGHNALDRAGLVQAEPPAPGDIAEARQRGEQRDRDYAARAQAEASERQAKWSRVRQDIILERRRLMAEALASGADTYFALDEPPITPPPGWGRRDGAVTIHEPAAGSTPRHNEDGTVTYDFGYDAISRQSPRGPVELTPEQQFAKAAKRS
jgi:hypothetical protein